MKGTLSRSTAKKLLCINYSKKEGDPMGREGRQAGRQAVKSSMRNRDGLE